MSIDALLLRLEEDAEREAARIRGAAAERAAAITARADADAERTRSLHLERVRADRRAAGERLVATFRAHAREEFLVARAEVLDQVLALASVALEQMPADRYVQRVGPMAVDAARYLERAPAVLQAPADAASTVAEAVQGLPNVTVEAADVPAGVIGHSADGRVVVDNTLRTLLERRRGDLAISLSTRIERG